MTDWLTREQRSRNMASIRSKGNKSTESQLVTLLRALKIHGWRRHIKITGTPDFVFYKGRVAVFVDGCFWHGCPRCYRLPHDNREYWKSKLSKNRKRDRRITKDLQSKNWHVVRIWEHQLKTERSRNFVASKIQAALEEKN